MRKFLLSFFVFTASAVYVAYQSLGGGSASTPPIATNTQDKTVSKVTEPNATEPKPTTPIPTKAPVPTPTPKPTGQYVDGTYTGSVADAYYGYVQVQAVIQGGKLTDVIFLQHPSDRRTSQYINDQAMPYLKTEAIQAQSANVSGVSGASDTSMAFIQSLKDALAKAKNV